MKKMNVGQRFINYVNPFGENYKPVINKYHQLSFPKQAAAVIASIIPGILTFWCGGIGGTAVFHALVDFFDPAGKRTQEVAGNILKIGTKEGKKINPLEIMKPETLETLNEIIFGGV